MRNGGSRYDDQKAPSEGDRVAAAAIFRYCLSDGEFSFGR